MPTPHILVIEDEKDIQELLRYNLNREGYKVTLAGTGEDGLKVARLQSPALILLDLMLPGINGLEVCRELKNDTHLKNIPIVMITARGEEADIVTGLEMGSDDYIVKPFSPRVLLARVKAILRRKRETGSGESEPLQIYDLVIHPGRHEVLYKETPISLTSAEFRLLHFLAMRPGWVFTRNQIVDAVKGQDYPVTERSVDVTVVNLRKKLGPAGIYIETVRGVGYRFKEE
jgi:two-component system alkaline phosphatase synthesis response regulator PhoP